MQSGTVHYAESIYLTPIYHRRELDKLRALYSRPPFQIDPNSTKMLQHLLLATELFLSEERLLPLLQHLTTTKKIKILTLRFGFRAED